MKRRERRGISQCRDNMFAEDFFKIQQDKHGANASAVPIKHTESKKSIRASGDDVKPTIVRAIKCDTLPDECGGIWSSTGLRICGYWAVFVFVGINIKISLIEAFNSERDSEVLMV
jgi:hypothetical protein